MFSLIDHTVTDIGFVTFASNFNMSIIESDSLQQKPLTDSEKEKDTRA